MTETIHFREGAAGDRDAILALRQITFPTEDLEKRSPDFWTWEFRDGYAGPARFFVAETDGTLVGHVAFVPQQYEAGQMVTGALFVEAMTHPGFRRRRVFSGLTAFAAEKLRKHYQIVTIVQIRKPVLPGMLAAGWREVRKIPVLLKPLSLLQIARDFGLPGGTNDKSGESKDESLQTIQPEDVHQLDALLTKGAIRQPRTAAFVRWRYLQSPHWRYELHGAFEGPRLCAFVIHRQTVLRGVRTLAIADLGALPGRDASLHHLLQQICRNGKARGMSVAAAFLSREHPAYRSLRTNGFFPGPHRFRLLVQVFDDALRWDNDRAWSLSWGDTDHL